MPEVFLFWAHHDINMLYAFRKRASKVLPGNTSRLHINTKPEDPKSTPHPKWKVWQLSGNMVVEVIPGIDSNGMCIFQKGLVDRFTPTVALHAASSPKQCQSVASQRWHFSLQLKPQLRWKALDVDNWQGKGPINKLGIFPKNISAPKCLKIIRKVLFEDIPNLLWFPRIRSAISPSPPKLKLNDGSSVAIMAVV